MTRDFNENRSHRTAFQRQDQQQALVRHAHELESLQDGVIEPRADSHPEFLRHHRKTLRSASQNGLDGGTAGGDVLRESFSLTRR